MGANSEIRREYIMHGEEPEEKETGRMPVRKIPSVLIISIFVAMISAVWGVTQSFISYRITENHQLIAAHAESDGMHMPMEQKIQLFVLRQEYEKDIREIKEDLKDILKKLEKMGEEK